MKYDTFRDPTGVYGNLNAWVWLPKCSRNAKEYQRCRAAAMPLLPSGQSGQSPSRIIMDRHGSSHGSGHPSESRAGQWPRPVGIHGRPEIFNGADTAWRSEIPSLVFDHWVSLVSNLLEHIGNLIQVHSNWGGCKS